MKTEQKVSHQPDAMVERFRRKRNPLESELKKTMEELFKKDGIPPKLES
jgi:hypothetical protein